MIVLRPQLPFDPEETCLSFANRLALLHTGRGVRQLLRDLGIDVPGFLSGHAAEVAALADAAGVSSNALLENSVDVKQTHAWFRGERQSKAFLSPRASRYCPACLAEEEDSRSWRQRLIWGIRHVHRCDRHDSWLNLSPDATAEVCHGVISKGDLAERRPAVDPPPEYQCWLRTRLHGQASTPDEWMDSQTLEQILNASEMLGAVLEHGHDVRPTKLSPEAREEAIDIGFSIFREGPQAVTEALDTIHAASPAAAVQAGPLAYYGRLFDWLDRRSNAIAPGPIRDILREHIVRNFAVEPGTTVLGEEVSVRRSYTLQGLSEELRMDRRRLSRVLQKLGKVPLGAADRESGNMIFDAAETIPLIEAFQSAVRLHEVPFYLGASKRQVENLYRAGILEPLIPATSRGAVRNVVFARSHLDEVLSRIDQLPVVSEADRADYHPVPYACQRGAGAFEAIFTRIMASEIQCCRDPRIRGIGGLIVRLDDVLERCIPA